MCNFANENILRGNNTCVILPIHNYIFTFRFRDISYVDIRRFFIFYFRYRRYIGTKKETIEDFHLSSSASTRVSLNAVYAYGEGEDYKVGCFVGVSDQPEPDADEMFKDGYYLTSGNDWPYYADCDVDRKTGEIEFVEFVVPEG